MKTIKEISEVKAELADRFGPLPEETSNLLLKIMLRVLCIQAGVKRLDLTENQLMLRFSRDHQKTPQAIVDMIIQARDSFSLTPDHVFKARLGTSGPLTQVKNILKDIAQRVNNC
jgi:transcription-repair coupling factor (superfamily II helicase)